MVINEFLQSKFEFGRVEERMKQVSFDMPSAFYAVILYFFSQKLYLSTTFRQKTACLKQQLTTSLRTTNFNHVACFIFENISIHLECSFQK